MAEEGTAVEEAVAVEAVGAACTSLKTQGRACLIARMFSLVILNSISMANGSPGPGLYSPAKWSWITSR